MADRWNPSPENMTTQRTKDYRSARPYIHDGDVLLFRRRRGLAGKLIATAGRSPYSHAAMAAWWRGRLMCLETLQSCGGRAVLLSNLVEEGDAEIDVFSIKTWRRVRQKDRQAAVEAMLEITGRKYGWWALLKAAIRHLPIVRLFAPVITDDEADGELPFCSQAVAWAWRRAGLDLVPKLADRLTEPGDLARSAALKYRFTLRPHSKMPAPADQEVA